MRAAVAGRFDELWTYKFDRLGRDAVDLLVVRRRLLELGIRVRSVVEGEPDLLGYDVQAVVADHGRRDFLRRSADGMNRCAREGRYVGGVVPYGYRVVGVRPRGRLEPDTATVWADLSAAGVIQRMYGWLANERWSCRRIAAELNSLGIPTHHSRQQPGLRAERTQGVWRAGGCATCWSTRSTAASCATACAPRSASASRSRPASSRSSRRNSGRPPRRHSSRTASWPRARSAATCSRASCAAAWMA